MSNENPDYDQPETDHPESYGDDLVNYYHDYIEETRDRHMSNEPEDGYLAQIQPNALSEQAAQAASEETRDNSEIDGSVSARRLEPNMTFVKSNLPINPGDGQTIVPAEIAPATGETMWTRGPVIGAEFEGPEGRVWQRLLCDTGSGNTLIPKSIAKACGWHVLPITHSYLGMGGKPMGTSVGTVYLYGCIDEIGMRVPLTASILPDEQSDFLLGNNFMTAARMSVHCGAKSYSVQACSNGGSITLRKWPPMLKFQERESTIDLDRRLAPNYVNEEERRTQRAMVRCVNPDDLMENQGGVMTKLAQTINSELTGSQKERLMLLFKEYRDMFSRHKYDLGCLPHQMCPINIEISQSEVPYVKPYRLSPIRREIMQVTINELLEMDIIEESIADGGAPALLVPKPDGSVRFVVDYSKLNQKLKKRDRCL